MHLIKRTDAPTFDVEGTNVTAYAAPSRGAAEVSLWQIELAPGSTSPLHHMDREEVFLGVSGRAVATVDGVAHDLGPGDCLILPAGTDFTLHVPEDEPYRAMACVPAGAMATMAADGTTFLPALGRVTEPDLAILITAANRCVADRLGEAVATAGGDRMRPSFGFVLRAVAAERPTVSRLAELLGVSKQGASRLADDMVSLGYLERSEDPADRRRTHLRLSATGERIRARALAESRTMEDELRERFGDTQVGHLRALLIDFIERHGGADEIAAQRSRAPEEPS